MNTVNEMRLLGSLGSDPDIRYTSGQKVVVTLSVATSEPFKDNAGNWQERTEWHRVVVFGKPAEYAAERFKKGSMVYVEARSRTRKWQDNFSKDQYSHEFVASKIIGLKNLRDKSEKNFNQHAPPTPIKSENANKHVDVNNNPFEFNPNDIPF